MTDTPDTTTFEHLLNLPNVVAVDYDPETDTVNVWVARKVPQDDLAPAAVVSNNVSGHETDVHDTGMTEGTPGITPEILDPVTDIDLDAQTQHADRYDRHRPVPPGVSEIHEDSTAATAGHYPAEVVDTSLGVWDDIVQPGDLVRISNCHVYARSGSAFTGDRILQPSPYDGGDEDTDTIGYLDGYLPLEDGVRADVAARCENIDREMEATAPHDLPEDWPTGIRRELPAIGEELTKTGRTTGVTTGEVLATNASIRVRYDHGVVTFREQLITTDMSQGGDSGSPVYDTGGRLIAHVYAGSPEITAHNTVAAMEADFGIQFMDEPPEPTPDEHESELSFETWVEQFLIDRFGAENVETQVRFETDRTCDILVNDPENHCQWAIELENDSGSAVNGTGQAEHYAHRASKERPERGAGIAVLGIPAGHIDADEKQDFQERGTVVWELDVPESVSIEGV